MGPNGRVNLLRAGAGARWVNHAGPPCVSLDMHRWTEARATSPGRLWPWLRLAAGVLVLAFLVVRLGAGPFLDGVRRVSPTSLAAAALITAGTTSLSAWRWRLIARGLGLDIPMRTAIASYYRSQLLNSTLPSGVLGDVHRGVRHGQESGEVGLALRSVVWDRAAGQVVQVALATVVLLAWPSPIRPAMEVVGGLVVAVAVAVVLVALAVPHEGLSWPARVTQTIRADLRTTLLTWERGPAVVAASAAVVAGHVTVFLVAAGADSWTSARALLPLALIVMLSMSVPTNIGGWGPREGVAAWAFAAAGLGATQGVEVATTYGVLSLVATLPGLIALFVPSEPGADTTLATDAGLSDEDEEQPVLVGIGPRGAAHG
jgi:glycosyltransferase 2 family protein